MFSRLLFSIKESITRTSSNGRTGTNKHTDYTSDCDSRRPSVTEELQNTGDVLSKLSTTQSAPVNIAERSKSVSEPIPIGSVASAVSDRRGSLFGISNVTYDDYVQKDLISTSWS